MKRNSIFVKAKEYEIMRTEIDQESIYILRQYRRLLSKSRIDPKSNDLQLIRKAFSLAVAAHKDVRRKSGEPYILHPLAVAEICAGEIGLGTTSIVCALLHDVVEDSGTTLDEIQEIFGDRIARIVDGLTKIRGAIDQRNPSMQAENFRKILVTMAEDLRVILIKLADRLHNMRTLSSLSKDKQLKIASETKVLYAPLAHRLGLYNIKTELDDLVLKYTDPEVYNNIQQQLLQTKLERGLFINDFIHPVKSQLAREDFDFSIQAREKSVSSIWDKMKQKGIPFKEVYDIFAIRIIIDCPEEKEKAECLRVYAIVSDIYKPNTDRLRDWISIPKLNGYTALHVTVMSKIGQWVEVQIRSKRMDEIAEFGLAAHWRYKATDKKESAIDLWLEKVRQLLTTKEFLDAIEFLDEFKLNLFNDEIYTFSPKGEVFALPVGSTALDFAYNIHSEIGNRSIGAKVNYNLVALNHQLNSGDQVEIITSKKQSPKEEWLNYVSTARAKTEIREAVRNQKRTHFDEGKMKLESFFVSCNLEFNKVNLRMFQEHKNMPSLIDLYYEVAIGHITLKDVKNCCGKQSQSSWLSSLNFFKKSRIQPELNAQRSKIIEDKIKTEISELVLGDKVENIHYEISHCCEPISGDDVIGIIDDNQTIKIHRTNCPIVINQMSTYGNRIVKAKWKTNDSVMFLAGLKVVSFDRMGIVYDITNIISNKYKLRMRSFNIDTNNEISIGEIMLYVYDTATLDSLINDLKQLDDVRDVVRITPSENKLALKAGS